jgi:hypothetical protein
MTEFSGQVTAAILSSALGSGVMCWVIGFFIGRCIQRRINDGSDDPFIPVTIKTPIIVKSTSSSS